MSRSTRNLNNLPAYYQDLTTKQQSNWRRNTRKIERNEQLREQHPPFQTPSTTTIIHIHHRTSIEILDELIEKARTTNIYTIDTESQIINRVKEGALVQIEFVQPGQASTIILIETFHLPANHSTAYKKIKELCGIILDGNKDIITWGPLPKEFKDFHSYGLFKLGKINEKINLQNDFSDWHNDLPSSTHPARESRDENRRSNTMYETPGETLTTSISNRRQNHPSHYDPNATWSLQDAVALTCQQFLDKTETINKWTCGLDIQLNTWTRRLFSKHYYDPHEEKEKRQILIDYAVGDCIAVTKLYFIMNPSKLSITNKYETPFTNEAKMDMNDIVDISDDEDEDEEIIQLLSKPVPSSSAAAQDHQRQQPQQELFLQVTKEEIDELNQQQQSPEAPRPQQRTKAEKQKLKNEKLKWKQQNLPDFQRNIKRPIYYRYDYRKIRAQLKEDKINTSHQLTINKRKGEVIIGMKSKQEEEQSRKKMPVNYFSMEEYYRRWG